MTTTNTFSNVYTNIINQRHKLNTLDMLKEKYRILDYKRNQIVALFATKTFKTEQERLQAFYKALDQIDDYIQGRVIYSINRTYEYEENTIMTLWEPKIGEIVNGNKKIKTKTLKSTLLSSYSVNEFLKNSYQYDYKTFDSLYFIPFAEDFTSNMFEGKKFCITGATDIRRESIAFLINVLGGTYQSAVSSKTDYLITTASLLASGRETTKMKKARVTSSQIKIISDRDLIDMMPDLPLVPNLDC